MTLHDREKRSVTHFLLGDVRKLLDRKNGQCTHILFIILSCSDSENAEKGQCHSHSVRHGMRCNGSHGTIWLKGAVPLTDCWS